MHRFFFIFILIVCFQDVICLKITITGLVPIIMPMVFKLKKQEI
jgi:hypothetical protein